MPAVQATSYTLLFALSDAGNPNEPFELGVPFASGEIQVVTPGSAIADADNLATVVYRGGGFYELEISAAELTLGLAPGETGEIGILIDKVGAILRQPLVLEVVATAPGTLTPAQESAIVSAIAAATAPLATAAGVTAATAPLATAVALASVADAVGGLPAAPSSAAIAAAVAAIPVDGARTLAQAIRNTAARLCNVAQVPMGAAGGTIEVKAADGTTTIMTGAISSTGAITWTFIEGE